jgi:uncharacterized delta-60 repeat protein
MTNTGNFVGTLHSDHSTGRRRCDRPRVVWFAAGLSFVQLAFGSLAHGFGVDGKVVTPLPGVSEAAQAIVRQPDGRLVTVGGVDGGFFVVRHNADGSLDASFGTGGHVVTKFPGGSGEATAVALQTNGKIVVAGATSRSLSAGSFALARYNADGTLDPSFDGDGLVTTAFSDGARANAVLIQPDGKIVAAGEMNGAYALARYNADGSLDTSFDGDGRATNDITGFSDAAFSVALQADGKIIAAGGAPYGEATFTAMGVTRYNADGSIDSTFGTSGVTRVKPSDGYAVARAVALQVDGKIVLAGYTRGGFSENSIDYDFAVARLLTNGTPDFAFGSGNIVRTKFADDRHADAANAVVIQPDGKIVAAGAVRYQFGSPLEGSSLRTIVGLIRYNPNGTLDTSFGASGKVTAPFTDLFAAATSPVTHDRALAARGVALMPDGKIVTAGQGFYPGTKGDIVLTRFNANGSLDDGSAADATPGDSFGANGKVRTDFGLLAEANEAAAAAVQPDGRILVAGGGETSRNMGSGQFDLLRYHQNGERDLSFGGGGRASAVFSEAGGLVPAAATSVVVQPNGMAVVAGVVHGGDNSRRFFRAALARFTPDGALDPQFGSNGTAVATFETLAYAKVALQPDGKIVLVSTTASSSDATGQDVIVARYNADGSPDASFDGDGNFAVDFSDLTGGAEGSPDDAGHAVIVQPDGRIFIGGSSPGKILLARFNGNGSPDSTFDGDGRAVYDTAGFVADFARQGDGKFVAVGDTTNDEGVSDLLLARFNADGSADTGFGSAGTAAVDFGGDEKGNAVAIDPTGKIVVAGRIDTDRGTEPDFLLARFNPDSSPDLSFGAQGSMTRDFFGEFDDARDVVVLPDGRVIAVGTASTSTFEPRIALVGTGGGRLLNIATRMRVQTGDNVLIGGLIVSGTEPKRVIIRAIGSSLAQVFDGALADPVLELFQGDTLVAANDNWRDTQQSQIEATTIPPSDDRESAIVQTLAPGFYTAVMSGKDGGTGIGVIEAYDLAAGASSKLGNIASRGFVDTGDNVMIGGLIVGGSGEAATRVLVRAIGPSIGRAGVAGALQDPTLELRDNNGALVRENDNWQDSQRAEIEATTIPPSDPAESAIVATLPPGNYTAIVRGQADGTGVGLVEVYNVP